MQSSANLQVTVPSWMGSGGRACCLMEIPSAFRRSKPTNYCVRLNADLPTHHRGEPRQQQLCSLNRLLTILRAPATHLMSSSFGTDAFSSAGASNSLPSRHVT